MGIPNKKLTERSKEFLSGQYYPGNVRELRNIMERAITLSDEERIDLQHLQSAPLRHALNSSQETEYAHERDHATVNPDCT